VVAVDFIATNHKGGISFMVLGIILLIPGCYSSYSLYGYFRGWTGEVDI